MMTLASHWNDPSAVGRKCMQCGFAATHSAAVPLGAGTATHWLCTNHAGAFAAQHGLAFPTTAQPHRLAGRTST